MNAPPMCAFGVIVFRSFVSGLTGAVQISLSDVIARSFMIDAPFGVVPLR